MKETIEISDLEFNDTLDSLDVDVRKELLKHFTPEELQDDENNTIMASNYIEKYIIEVAAELPSFSSNNKEMFKLLYINLFKWLEALDEYSFSSQSDVFFNSKKYALIVDKAREELEETDLFTGENKRYFKKIAKIYKDNYKKKTYKKEDRVVIYFDDNEFYIGTIIKSGAKIHIEFDDGDELILPKSSNRIIGKGVSKKNAKPITNKNLKKWVRSVTKPININYIFSLLDFLRKKKYQKDFPTIEKTLFNCFLRIYKDWDELQFEDIVLVLKYSYMITNPKLRSMVKTIKYDEANLEKSLKNILENSDRLAKKLFGTKNPSTEMQKKFEKKKPKTFKAWRKVVNAGKKETKMLLNDLWINRHYVIESTKKAKSLLKKAGLDNPIDKKFRGKISLSKSPTGFFDYYTKWGKQLDQNVGVDVIMNEDYDPETDDAAYCTFLPRYSTDESAHAPAYTLENRKIANGDGYEAMRVIGKNIEDIRITSGDKIAEGINKNKESKDRIEWLSACILRLVDLTYARVGSVITKATTHNGKHFEVVNKKGKLKFVASGMHNLIGKNLKLQGNKVVISYIGKASMPQSHVISDPQMVKVLRQLKKRSGNKGFIFTKEKGGSLPINTTNVTGYLRKMTGNKKVKVKYFRKYHGSRIFSIELAKIKKRKNISAQDLAKAFNEATLKVGKALGHKKTNKKTEELETVGTTAIKNYIDPVLTTEWFQHFNIDIPKGVAKNIQNSYMDKDNDD
jgi:DNA topoisomerase IB